MSGSHEKLPWLFWAQLALAATVLILYLLAPTPKKHGESEHSVSESSKQTLKPVGEVVIASADGASGVGSERTGKEIVEKTCKSCHAHGVANAPKLDDSAKAAWESRLANGMDGMMKIAKVGKGAMPAMGTDPTLSDAELKNAIVYMLGKAGVDVPTDGGAVADEPASPKDESTVDSSAPAEPKAPKSPEEDTSATATVPEPLVAPEPAKAPVSADTFVEASAPEAPAAPEQPAATTLAAAATTAANTGSSVKSALDGKKIYQSSCFSCHATGVAGSPKVADKGAWSPRIAAGVEALYEAAIKGKGVMPPKGGNMSLSDDQIKAAVDYMVSQSQ